MATVHNKIVGWDILWKNRLESEGGMQLIGVMRSRGKADETRVIPESTCKALTEEPHQDQLMAGLTAVSYGATRVLANTDKAPQSDACVRWAALTKQQIIEVVRRKNEMASITSSLCRECHTVHMDRGGNHHLAISDHEG